jgi:hypothetical protein
MEVSSQFYALTVLHQGKSSHKPLERKWTGLKQQSQRGGREKNLFQWRIKFQSSILQVKDLAAPL